MSIKDEWMCKIFGCKIKPFTTAEFLITENVGYCIRETLHWGFIKKIDKKKGCRWITYPPDMEKPHVQTNS